MTPLSYPGSLTNHIRLPFIVVTALAASIIGEVSAQDPLPVLTKVKEVRELARNEAQRGYPVRLRGVVTGCDLARNLVFVQDSTAGISIEAKEQVARIEQGQSVEIEGVTAPGKLTSTATQTKWRIIGTGAMPTPIPVTPAPWWSGLLEGQWVELQGVIRSVSESGGDVLLEVAGQTDRIYKARITRSSQATSLPTYLVDSAVRIHGVASAQFNPRGRFLGLELLVCAPDEVRVEKPAPADPFSVPTQAIRAIGQYIPLTGPTHRIKVQGVVTRQHLGKSLYIQDETLGLYVQTEQRTPVQVGERVEVAGFRTSDPRSPSLRNAVFRRIGTGPPPAPADLSPEQVLEGSHEKRLVRLEGLLSKSYVRSGSSNLVLVLHNDTGSLIFHAVLDGVGGATPLPSLDRGSRLQLTGICRLQTDEQGTPRSFRVVLRSAEDVVVLERPPWWTSQRVQSALALMGVSILAAVGWAAALRRSVRRRTAELSEANALLSKISSAMEQTEDNVIITDREGVIEYVNRGFSKITGYTKAEALGQTPRLLKSDHHAAAFYKRLWETITGGQPFHAEFVNRRKSGELYHEDKTITPLRNERDHITHFVSVGRDITEDKCAEQALQQSEFSLREAQRMAHLGNWELALMNLADLNQNPLRWSDEVFRIFGYAPGQIEGTNENFFRAVHPDDREIICQAVAQAVLDRQDYSLDHRIVLASGEVRFVHEQGRVLFDEQTGKPARLAGTVHDITERKQAEEVMRGSMRRLSFLNELAKMLSGLRPPADLARVGCRFIVESLHYLNACVMEISTNGDELVMLYNAGQYEALTRPGEYRQRIGVGIMGQVARHGQRVVVNETRRHPGFFQLEGRPIRAEAAFPLKAGDHLIGVLNIDAAEAGAFDGETEELLVTIADQLAVALERARLLERLRASEERYRALVDHAPTGIFINLDGKFVYVNEAFCRILGARSPEQLLGMSVFDRFHPEFHDTIRERMQHVLTTGAPVPLVDQRYLRLDGSEVPVETTASVITFEGRQAFQVLVNDVTPRKEAERRLAAFAELGRRLSSARDAREAAEIILDAADKLFGWDAAVLDLYSAEKDRVYPVLTKDRINGQRVDCPAPDAEAAPSAPARRAIEYGAHLILKDAPGSIPFGDTSRPSATLMFVPIRDGANVIGVLSIQSYIAKAFTEHDLETLQSVADYCGGTFSRIQARETLRVAEEQLRQSQKMEAIGQLAGGVAHDFNNLLTVIQGHTGLLLMENGLSGRVTDAIGEIALSAERAANLTRQLLTFSRRQAMQPACLDLNQVVSSVTKMLQRILGEDIMLQVSYAPKLPWIKADQGMLEQVLMNLAVNARDAMPHGGRLMITTSELCADEDYRRTHPEVSVGTFTCLEVSDTGCGIPSEHLPLIFEPFFTTKEVGRGTGLGLATVYGIVQQHHGWIKVSSEVAQGTIFRICLPATEEKPTGKTEINSMNIRGGRETIFIVEHNPSVRELARSVLERYGYAVLEASDGTSALNSWEEHKDRIDLLLTDLVMPNGMTGLELAEKLQADNPRLRVIYTSGYSADVVAPKFRLREEVNFLQKPYHVLTLARTVRQRLDGLPVTETPTPKP
ncbi:MAG: PAS domain S-box protein [Verrucomicrobia bacterium]|nr:PAS domain S-box protein [Verrucomicrobiota bacterium]